MFIGPKCSMIMTSQVRLDAVNDGETSWPSKPDKILYTGQEIIRKINLPELVSYMGQFKYAGL